MQTQVPMKATPLDDDAFRLLALPYGGPIPYPGAPRGADLDRQWLSESTDFGDKKRVDVTWHHGLDRKAGREVIGKAVDLAFDDDGGWVTVWLDHGRRRVQLIRQLAQAAADDPDPDLGVFGSSEAIPQTARIRAGKAELPWRRDIPGEISRWWYSGQTLSTSPQNTTSILMPVKATLSDLASGEIDPTGAFFSDLTTFLDSLAPSSETGKAGRVVAARNEARIREARDAIDEAYFDTKRRRAAIAALTEVLEELERYVST
jgi:hypothetical protein